MKYTTKLVYDFWLIVGVFGVLSLSIYDRGELNGSPGWLIISGCFLLFAVAAFGLGMRWVWGWWMLTALLGLLSLFIIIRLATPQSGIIIGPSEPLADILMAIVVNVLPPVLGLFILLSDPPDRWRNA